MSIGMAVNSGESEKKTELIQMLLAAAGVAKEIDLWVEGRPFEVTLRMIANQL